MPFCTNPECPHKKKTGKPAEFLENFTHCSDCGSPLSEKITGEEKIITKQKPSKISRSDFQKRLLYTLGFVLLWRILTYIPLPGIDFDAIEGYLSSGKSFGLYPRVSVFALGLMPYFGAYVLVECLALFIPPLKSWRQGGYPGRAKLLKTALWATLVLAFIQGFAVARGIEGWSDGFLVLHPGWNFRIITVLTLTTGTFITVLIANLITKKGIGHGISILLFTGLIGGSFREFSRLFSRLSSQNKVSNEYDSFEYFLVYLLVTVILIFLIVFIEKTLSRIQVRFDDNTEAYIPLKLTTAGIVPVSWAASLVMLPATIAGFSESTTFQEIAVMLSPGKIGYFLVCFITIIFFYYLFTALFHKPKKMINFLKERNASIVLPSGENGERYIDRRLEVMAFIGALYLCLLFFLPDIFLLFGGYFIGSVALIKIVAIALDLIEETRMRRNSGSLVKVAEFHDVPKAGLLKSLLEQKGISCHLRGYYHRALLYFFAPYIEISALVSKEKVNEANDVIKRYLDLK